MKVIFWGATGQAKVLQECLKEINGELVALFDNNTNLSPIFKDVPLYYGKEGFEKWFQSQKNTQDIGFLVAIGGDKGKDRVEIQDYLQSYGLKPIIAQHPTAFVADNAQIGAGSQILAQSAVCVNTIIGRSCIINTSASVDHECSLGEGVHICPGAHLAGCVVVENYAMIGTGAVVLPRIKINEGAIIGAGAVVTKEVAPYSIVVGNPARFYQMIK